MKRSILKQLQKYLKHSKLIFKQSNQWQQSINRYALHDLQPLATVKCQTIDDVQTSLKFSKQHDIDFVIKSGGINQACTSIRSQHLVVDLSLLKRVRERKQLNHLRINFEAGVNFNDMQILLSLINKEHKSGYAMPMAFYRNISCIGALSITGNGAAHRVCGLGVDLIKRAKIVLWDGSLAIASQHQNKDLLWGIKGCGPSLGAIVQAQMELQQVCNVLDPQQSKQIRQYVYQFPINHQTISIGQQLKLFCQKITQKIFPHLIFINSPNFSAIFMTLYQFLYKKSNQSKKKQVKELMDQLFVKYHQNINTVTYEDKYYRQICLPIKQDQKKNYIYIFGGYANIQNLANIVSEINRYYIENPIKQFNNPSVNFLIIINYLQSEAFQKRDPSSTSWQSSKNDNLLVYGNISFDDAMLDKRCYQYMKNIRDRLQVYFVRGSACDFNKRDITERNLGKWIYGQNYDKLKGLKAKFDPFNKFNTGLL